VAEKIFISYSRSDKAIANALVPLLQEVFERVWIDKELTGGDLWEREIMTRIRDCDIFVLLVSQESLASKYVKEELDEARRRNKPILPVLIQPGIAFPPDLSTIQFVDMTGGITPEALTKIHAAIKKISSQSRAVRRGVNAIKVIGIITAVVIALGVIDLLRGSEQLAFVSDRDGDLDIYVMDIGPSLIRRLIGGAPRDLSQHSADDYGPEWSPDGSRIAYVTVRDGNPEIYVMGADGSNPQRVTNNDATDTNPTWSPDGTRIAFQSDRINTISNPASALGGVQREANFDIYVIDVALGEGGQAIAENLRQLTHDASNDEFPAWSPDGRQIAFQSDRISALRNPGLALNPPTSTNFDIYLVEADGTLPRNLTSNPDANDLFPTWTHDGGQIAFVSNRTRSEVLRDPTAALNSGLSGGNFEIYVISRDGRNLRYLTANPANDESPTWSPDSNQIAFVSNRGSGREPLQGIYLMDANGNNVLPLTDDSVQSQSPVWRPGG
jgi:Tol biopolymer transport system component